MTLVVPDVHGRNFWKEPCKNFDKYEKIVLITYLLDSQVAMFPKT